MPIQIPNDLPATETLQQENIFVMNENRAITQDIRPLEIVLLNLMPTKIATETQLSRVLGNTPLQVRLELMHMRSHVSKNTSQELCEIMEWSKTNVHSTFHICWGAQAGMYYHYGIQKQWMPKKLFGVFPHTADYKRSILLRGFDDVFWVPHSRHTTVKREDIEAVPELKVIASSERGGVYAVMTKKGRQIFVTGHAEYDADTLHKEYIRDKNQGIDIAMPENYYPNDDDTRDPMVTWRGHGNLLFSNWLNYFVYQTTPYDIMSIGDE